MKAINCFLLISLFFSACSDEQEQETVFPYGALFQENLKCMNMPRPDDSYNYPVYPGMEEWAKFKTGQERLDACQIPTSTLEKMSTQAVVQAIWEHPLLLEIFHRYRYQGDFESMFSTNNAYMELAKRNDAGAALYERFLVVNPLTTYPGIEELKTLELLISQPVFIAQLDDDQKKNVVKTAIEHDGLRQQDAAWADNTFAGSLRVITWLLVGRTMFAAGYTPLIEAANGNEHLKAFLEHKDYLYMKEEYGDIPQQIIELSNAYLNE
jgi:hypothetical protein